MIWMFHDDVRSSDIHNLYILKLDLRWPSTSHPAPLWTWYSLALAAGTVLQYSRWWWWRLSLSWWWWWSWSLETGLKMAKHLICSSCAALNLVLLALAAGTVLQYSRWRWWRLSLSWWWWRTPSSPLWCGLTPCSECHSLSSPPPR